MNNLHEHMDSCKSGITKHATIVATTAFYRRVENGLHHTFTITIRQLFSAQWSEIKSSSACRNSSFHVQFSTARLCERLPPAQGGTGAESIQITWYSRSRVAISVPSSFLSTFLTTAFSMKLSFISVTGAPSRSLTVALSRLRTS